MIKYFTSVFIFAFIFRVGSFQCHQPHEHRAEMLAYSQLTKSDKIGSGAFGVVYRLRAPGKAYAVKEIVLQTSDYLDKEIKRATGAIKAGVERMRQALENTPDFYTKTAAELAKTFSSTDKMYYQYSKDVIDVYVESLKQEHQELVREVKFNELVTAASQQAGAEMSYKFNFCVQVNGLKYLLFEDLYGDDFGTDAFWQWFSALDLKGRMRFYLELIRRVFFLHRQGIIHCDLKFLNFVANGAFNNPVILDYGISMLRKKCKGGTIGFNAPETIMSDLKLAHPEINAYKADVYSLGMIIAQLELKVYNPTLNLVQEQQRITLAGGFSPESKNVVDVFDNYIQQAASKAVLEATAAQKKRTMDFYHFFASEIRNLIAPKVSDRSSLSHTFKTFWIFYQFTKRFDIDEGQFYDEMIAITNYPRKIMNKLVDLFTLPLNADLVFEETKAKDGKKVYEVVGTKSAAAPEYRLI